MTIDASNLDVLNAVLPRAQRFAIAFSGGGDSTALVHRLHRWTPKPLVLIVDHALRDGSASEAIHAQKFAVQLGLDANILTWGHDNPSTGLQEKARMARYGLLGQACRDAGISTLLTGHTEDDQAETLLMRYDRRTDWRGAAGIGVSTHAPIWPQLEGVTLLRPLLTTSRETLRRYNRSHALRWIEDPSNANRDFSRIKARDYLGSRPEMKAHLINSANELAQGRRNEAKRFEAIMTSWQFGWAGNVLCPNLPPLELLRLVLLCVSGTSVDTNREKLRTLYRRLKSHETSGVTLGGAQITRSARGFVLSRDPVAVKGRSDGALAPSARTLQISETPTLWDGRLIVSSQMPGFDIRANYQLDVPRSSALTDDLKALHKSARPTAPVIVSGGQAHAWHECPEVKVWPVIAERLTAILKAYGIGIA